MKNKCCIWFWGAEAPRKLLYQIGSQIDFIGICFTENPDLEKQDTFVEKLVTQVIKNLQVKISNIHVRYEDDVSTETSQWSLYVI